MTSIRNTLICTVGVSLLNNLSHSNDPSIAPYVKEERWKELGCYLAKHYPANDRMLGAEINSIAEIIKKRKIDLTSISFLLSQTLDAEKIKDIFLGYFEGADWVGVKPSDMSFITVEGLQDDDPSKFRGRGLRNLVKEMAGVVRIFGPEKVAINATGGYKAQIALAVVLGQALDIPVYYKHERFEYIIDLPPLPVTLDFDVLGRYGWLLRRLEDNEVLTFQEMGDLDDEVRMLLSDVKVGKETLWELSPVGQIYLEGFRQRVGSSIELKEASNRKLPNFPDHHRPSRYIEFVKKVWRENPWIYTCVDLGSDDQKAIKGTRFFTRKVPNGIELLGEYFSDYGARFRILLPTDRPNELVWAALKLNEKYSRFSD